ncbi:hypothetical protein [Caldithrix abyssi]|uniref:hypothetical protein n=1 Tax=Caldithrix abyssi TaxID=187145 RepID=UPI0009040D6C|nr:hypothetical protein [Caldithrix abyssi]
MPGRISADGVRDAFAGKFLINHSLKRLFNSYTFFAQQWKGFLFFALTPSLPLSQNKNLGEGKNLPGRISSDSGRDAFAGKFLFNHSLKRLFNSYTFFAQQWMGFLFFALTPSLPLSQNKNLGEGEELAGENFCRRCT